MLKIEKNIPIPKVQNGTGRPLKYPFRQMEKGDSFLILKDSISYGTAGQITRYWNKVLKSKKFIYRKVDQGYRIWREK